MEFPGRFEEPTTCPKALMALAMPEVPPKLPRSLAAVMSPLGAVRNGRTRNPRVLAATVVAVR